ncbi:hypothetical protein BU16DRAFT_536170 [Lophium mytilinum]|uniref:RING-type domain-containing protein n=1 Tax=Lophium mytilinum TaxID=390894 RepID=A0A6A6R5Y3_9PEZI|nr:hypothetical protein BU16DRAFT_536170 [Lophium mytilinum]
MALRFTYPLNKPPQFDKEVLGKYNDGCPICLRPFSTHDMAIQIIDPRCYHVFGHDCLDTWVQARPTCPLCRLNLLPAPVLVAALPVPRRTLKEIWKKHEDTASRVAFLLAWMLVLVLVLDVLGWTGYCVGGLNYGASTIRLR